MGYYGKTITGSDNYHDFTADFYYFFGYKDTDDIDDEYITKEMVEAKFDDMVKWFNSNFGHQNELQFLAYHLLRIGVDLSDDRIDLFISEFETDSWSKEDLERRIYMSECVEKLKKYKTDKSPIDIDSDEIDFEYYFIKKRTEQSVKIANVDEIKKMFEDKCDIVIKDVLTDNYNLIFTLSDDDFKKTNGSLFGVKFLMYVE